MAGAEQLDRCGHESDVPLSLAQMLVYIRDLRTLIDSTRTDIARLDDAIESANAHADDVAAQALIDARAEIDAVGRQLDEVQALICPSRSLACSSRWWASS
jgi:hypothetical protein